LTAPQRKPLIIVFAKAPVPGRVKTRLGLPADQAADLHRSLVGETLAGLQPLRHEADVELSVDVPTQAWDDCGFPRSLQVDGDLGTRMLGAIEAALFSGRPRVLILGSDSPQLPVGHVRVLLESRADVALGPTDDGGYYAIACSRVSRGMFDGVRWSTEHAYSDTVSAIERCRLTWERGRSWFDVDRAEDLDRPEVRRLLDVPPASLRARLSDIDVSEPCASSGVQASLTSIIIPTLNEAGCISATIRVLTALDGAKEIIVADGGSEDDTAQQAEALGALIVACERGRGVQLRTAAAASRGDVLWFLHADTVAPQNALVAIREVLSDDRVAAGNFALRFGGDSRAARNLTWIYPYLRFLGLAYGDSGIFVRRSVYEGAGGFRPYPLFEDLDLIRRLKKAGRFARLDCELVTSARRFENRYLRSWALWIMLQVLYWAGVPPTTLSRIYRHVR
jgi:rSAM/selenodomain-associated transferase 2/rSAM/selenodomain-associated transferase 1